MKAYLITTGIVFGLITLVHIGRIVAEGTSCATDPVFLLLTVLTAGLCAWAFALVRRLPRS